MLSEELVQSLGKVTITTPEHHDEHRATVQIIDSLYGKRPEWSVCAVNAPNGAGEEIDLNSLDSFALTDSPEGTASSTSQKSSHSSLSGLISRKSPVFGSDFTNSSKRFGHRRNESSCASSSLFSADMDKSVKNEYTTLRNHCVKFASQHNAVKANYLRLTLLPFLRKGNRVLLPSSSELDLPLKVFAMWWAQLLNVTANTNFKNVSGVDRNAFYEAISAIMSRPEWIDHHDKKVYQSLLTQTTNHTLMKCASISNLTVAQGAFGGKVIAYAYAYLPGFAPYFLSILAVDERTIDRILANDVLDSINITNDAFTHLKSLINARSLKNNHQRPNGLNLGQCSGWTRHLTVDSTLFASFFKHFCDQQTRFLPFDHHAEEEEFMEEGRVAAVEAAHFNMKRLEKMFLASPGTLIILAKILSLFDQVLYDMTRIMGPKSSSPYSSRRASRSPSISGNNSTYIGATERIRIDHLKILEAFREILHSDEETSPYFLVFSSAFDRIFKAMAAEVRAHDMEGCVMVCNIVEEWLSSVFAVRATKSQHTLLVCKQIVVDWSFWLNVVERMITTDNTYTNIRALSFLFNVWPHLPNDESISQLSGLLEPNGVTTLSNSSILQKTTRWVLSTPMWMKLFCNWSPLVRSYYHRLLCYRLASVGVGTKCWFLDVESANDLEESRQLLENMLSFTAQWCLSLSSRTDKFPETEPSLPLPRLRVGIRQFGPFPNPSGAKMERNLSKVYMFDIFDSAAYLRADKECSTSTQGSPMLLENQSEATPQVCRKSSRVSRISVDSADSVRSNASVLSNFSVRSVKSQIKRLSTSFLGSEKSDLDTQTRSDDQPQLTQPQLPVSNEASDEKDKAKQGFGKKWFSWNKNASRQPGEAQNEGAPKVKGEMHRGSPSQTSNEIKAEKKQSKDIFTSPPLLTELKPEIIRPSHRFVMIPTNTKPPSRRDITIPFMPFSRHDFNATHDFDPSLFACEKDLAIWNYGGRSLAEWNLEVLCFEHYAKQQRKVVDDTMEMFMMPFLVAEIPWRTQA